MQNSQFTTTFYRNIIKCIILKQHDRVRQGKLMLENILCYYISFFCSPKSSSPKNKYRKKTIIYELKLPAWYNKIVLIATSELQGR